MTPSERVKALAVMTQHGVRDCRRAVTTDATEEVLLVAPETMESLNVDAITGDLMAVLPHRKIWVVPDSARWKSEPLSRSE